MKAALFLVLFSSTLFCATLLNQNIYERENRVDLMLSFDSPFEGDIKKSSSYNGSITIKLSDVTILNPFKKELQNSIVESISISKSADSKAVIKIIPSDKKLKIEASKTVDGFGLRLRVTPISTSVKETSNYLAKDIEQTLNTQELRLKDSNTLPGWRYWSVLAVLLLLLIALWYIKKRKLGSTFKSGWLMPNFGGSLNSTLFDGAKIKYQKYLDRDNKLMLIEFNSKQYLLVVGSNNLLLDAFSDKKVESSDNFSTLFEENRKALDSFLKQSQPDAYETFKANASKDISIQSIKDASKNR